LKSGNLFKQSFNLLDLIETDLQTTVGDAFHSKDADGSADPDYKLKKQKLIQERNVKESLIGVTQQEQRYVRIQVERWTTLDLSLTFLVVVLIFCTI